MKITYEIPRHALQLFEPEANAVDSIEVAGYIAQMPRGQFWFISNMV